MNQIDDAIIEDLHKQIRNTEALRVQVIDANKDRAEMARTIDRLYAKCLKASTVLDAGLRSENCKDLGKAAMAAKRIMEQVL